jgi:ubiquinone/menaquinone biosynthesis C-methylase UbiE
MAKKNKKWKAYNDLAWVDLVVSPPEECRQEVERYCNYIIKNADKRPRTLLHLGCGAGIYDHTFKKQFNVTGVDVSKGMLTIARDINPELTYLHGDMRDVHLDKLFDAVVIPDSIGYMVSLKDLKKAIDTTDRHLNPGGILLIVAQLRGEFQNNNFVYAGQNEDVDITVFENNHIISQNKYEATIVYLIRRKKKVDLYSEKHTLGIFDLSTWEKIFKDRGFRVKKYKEKEMYQPFLLNEGAYPQAIFVCRKL